jgi:hypothetical protein
MSNGAIQQVANIMAVIIERLAVAKYADERQFYNECLKYLQAHILELKSKG